MKFLVSLNRSNFCFFLYIEILLNKHVLIEVDTTIANIMQFFSKIMTLAYFSNIYVKGVSTPTTFSIFQL